MAVYRLSEEAAERIISIYEYSLLNFGEEKADK
jgi:plasmid stabilization system protein ParE